MDTVRTNEFVAFPKIARLSRDIVITEKIDGTNAQVFVRDDGEVVAGSRNRYLTVEQDNFGFARWVREHEGELREGLGPGRHYGEWWGPGIQCGYGLKEKRFSLFNVRRWNDETPPPGCCHVVPVLYRGAFSEQAITDALMTLLHYGSVASPGFMRPEGIIIFHTASGTLFKKTIDGDEKPKGSREEG